MKSPLVMLRRLLAHSDSHLNNWLEEIKMMKIGKTSVLVILVSAFMALVIPSISYASDAQSMRKLRQVKRYIENRGAGGCRDNASGKYLSQGDYYIVRTTLYSGNSYFIIGAGDSSVRDLDIIMLDENYNEIDRDQKSDATPIVAVSPRWSGTYYIGVLMYSGSGYSNVLVCYK